MPTEQAELRGIVEALNNYVVSLPGGEPQTADAAASMGSFFKALTDKVQAISMAAKAPYPEPEVEPTDDEEEAKKKAKWAALSAARTGNAEAVAKAVAKELEPLFAKMMLVLDKSASLSTPIAAPSPLPVTPVPLPEDVIKQKVAEVMKSVGFVPTANIIAQPALGLEANTLFAKMATGDEKEAKEVLELKKAIDALKNQPFSVINRLRAQSIGFMQ